MLGGAGFPRVSCLCVCEECLLHYYLTDLYFINTILHQTPTMTNSLSSLQEVQDALEGSDPESDAPIFSEGPNPNPDDLPDPAELLILTEEFCRAITNGRVCGLPTSKCTRRGHAAGATRGEVGVYQSLGKQQSNSFAPDGNPDKYLSMEDYQQMEDQRTQQLLAEGREVGRSETSQAAFDRSPFKVPEEEDEDEGISSSVRHTTQNIFSGMAGMLKKTLKTPPSKAAERPKSRVDEARERKDRLTAEVTRLARAVSQEAADTDAANEESEAAELEAEAQELEEQLRALKARQAALRREGTRPNPPPAPGGGTGRAGRVLGTRPEAVPRSTRSVVYFCPVTRQRR